MKKWQLVIISIILFALYGASCSRSVLLQSDSANIFSSGSILSSVTIDFGATTRALQAYEQTDGKIFVSGYMIDSTGRKYEVTARLNSDGTLDSQFGVNGKVATIFGMTTSDSLNAITFDNMGKPIAAGAVTSGGQKFAVERYGSWGGPDTSFNSTGYNLLGILGTNSANAVTVQSDGKILAAGQSNISGLNPNFALVRYLVDGTLDSSFCDLTCLITGANTVDFGSLLADGAYAVTSTSSGSIFAAGYAINPGPDRDFAVVKLQSNGLGDAAFGTSGKKILAVTTGDDVAQAIAVQSDGNVLAAGYSTSGGNRQFAIIRLLGTNGAADPLFGVNGIQTINVNNSNNDEALSIALQADGKILLTGYANNGSVDQMAVMRLNSNGALDSTFGIGGILISTTNPGNSRAYSSLHLSTGKILLIGYTNNGSYDSMSVVWVQP